MEASAGLVAGSHNRNELVVIRRDSDPVVSKFPAICCLLLEVMGKISVPSVCWLI